MQGLWILGIAAAPQILVLRIAELYELVKTIYEWEIQVNEPTMGWVAVSIL